MGQNRRHDAAGRDLEKWAQAEARRPQPLGLSLDEVRITGTRRDASQPVPVESWVTHRVSYDEPRIVEAEAVAWTESAVLIRWTPEGASKPVHRWVWANAVRRR